MQQIEAARADQVSTIARAPNRLIIIDVVRCYRRRRANGEYLALGGHQVAPEVGLFATQQGGKVAIVPGGEGLHLAVDANDKPGGFRRIIGGTFIFQSGDDCQSIVLKAIEERVANTVSSAAKIGFRSFLLLQVYVCPCWSGERPTAKLDFVPLCIGLDLENSNRPVLIEAQSELIADQCPL